MTEIVFVQNVRDAEGVCAPPPPIILFLPLIFLSLHLSSPLLHEGNRAGSGQTEPLLNCLKAAVCEANESFLGDFEKCNQPRANKS